METRKQQEERERAETAEKLRQILKPGDTVYTVLAHVSQSGMFRKIDCYTFRDTFEISHTARMQKLIERINRLLAGTKRARRRGAFFYTWRRWENDPLTWRGSLALAAARIAPGFQVERRPNKIYLSGYVAEVTGFSRDKDSGALRVGGCGMDMGFHVVYSLGSTLYPNGYPCAGTGCRSNDHFNGEKNAHHRDGGYAFRQEWI